MPENTIPAMINALHRGAGILEMDIAFSKDKHPIVSRLEYPPEKVKQNQGDVKDEKEYIRKMVKACHA